MTPSHPTQMDQHSGHSKTRAAMLLATIAGLAAGAGFAFPAPRTARKARKPFPMMVTSSREVIAAWNAKVDQRNAVKLARWQA